ncbi:Mpo1 family 2-hydroxy fatty acid dioxygenase [Marinigracilibium pacificum]|uniref:DUF962 domain-containing protein n=1 Tax=Marinigracilibium pacificum TaxID=2729599 RepID=A0A848IVX2_9BACT|nr:Mpo1-like protein [Marinigracilibium pacificum]NMM48643.1 DUF962 domain-containing protein [Marinigracilibium pacificum]
MRKIEQLLSEYGESHKNHTNKTIHWICVPTIFFSIVGLIWSIPKGPLGSINLGDFTPYVNWATITLILVSIYYFSLSFKLALGMLVFGVICLYLCQLLDTTLPFPLWIFCIGIFIIAWIGQFIGHNIEGKKPSFLKDVQFLLIGPAWLMHFIFNKLKINY